MAVLFSVASPIVVRISAQNYAEPATDDELTRDGSKSRQTGFLQYINGKSSV